MKLLFDTTLLLIFSLFGNIVAVTCSAEDEAPATKQEEKPTNAPNKKRIITTLDGKTYENVTIQKVTVAGIEIIHSKGIASIPFANLDEAIRKEFNYNADKLKEHNNKQNEQREQRKIEVAKSNMELMKSFELYVIDKNNLVSGPNSTYTLTQLSLKQGDMVYGNASMFILNNVQYKSDIHIPVKNYMQKLEGMMAKDKENITTNGKAIDKNNEAIKDIKNKIFTILATVGVQTQTDFTFKSNSFSTFYDSVAPVNTQTRGRGTATTTTTLSKAQSAMLQTLYSEGSAKYSEILKLQEQQDFLAKDIEAIKKGLELYSSELVRFDKLKKSEIEQMQKITPAIQNKVPDDSQLKKKLAALKLLLDEGTLTREEYDKKVAEVIKQ